jgi:hypothetical protein
MDVLNKAEGTLDVFVDNVDTFERFRFGAKSLHGDDGSMTIFFSCSSLYFGVIYTLGHNFLSVDTIGEYNDIALRSLVYKAMQNQQTEILLGERDEERMFHLFLALSLVLTL